MKLTLIFLGVVCRICLLNAAPSFSSTKLNAPPSSFFQFSTDFSIYDLQYQIVNDIEEWILSLIPQSLRPPKPKSTPAPKPTSIYDPTTTTSPTTTTGSPPTSRSTTTIKSPTKSPKEKEWTQDWIDDDDESIAVVRWPQAPIEENMAHISLKFTWDSYNLLKKENPGGNVFFSPFCIMSCLGMLVLGSSGITQTDLVNILRAPKLMNNTNQIHEELKAENEKLKTETDITFGIANRFFVENNFISKIHPKYSSNLSNFYNVSLQPTPFNHNPCEARRQINAFVYESSNGEIPNILMTNPETHTKLSLFNAIYLKGQWTIPFKKEATKKLPFHGSTKDVVTDFKHLKLTKLLYGECDNSDCQLVVLPYTEKKKYAMIFIVPNRDLKLDLLEDTLDDQKLRTILKSAKKAIIDLAIPRFSMKNNFQLKDMINNMGAMNIFDKIGAENSKIFVEEIQQESLVDDLIHEAKIVIHEESVIAEIATANTVAILDAQYMEPNKMIILDRPFLFFIADMSNGFVLFFGRIENPDDSD